jgi:hypothetical protein
MAKMSFRHQSPFSPLAFAATVVICLAIGTIAYLNKNRLPLVASHQPEISYPGTYTCPENLKNCLAAMQVLSPTDVKLYRDIFEAQAEKNWTKADAAIAQLSDKRLLGHVLADRYERRPATSEELINWLNNYKDLPESQDVYKTAISIHDTPQDQIPQPEIAKKWSGNDGYGSAFPAFYR